MNDRLVNNSAIESHPKKSFAMKSQRELALASRNIENLRIIAMGDSSVFGVGDHGNAIPSVGYGWTGRIAHDLCAKQFINVAKNGARARDLVTSQLPAVLAFHPHIVLICIGTNDVLRKDFSSQEVRNHLSHICKSAVAEGSLVVLLGLPDPIRTAPGPLALRKILSNRILEINEVLIEIAEDGAALFVPTWSSKIAHEKRMWHVDRMHPSAYGHQHIADLVRRNLSLPRRSTKKLPVTAPLSRKFEMYWLFTNGAKWFAKRSIDLVPALIWILLSDKCARSK